MLRRPNVPYHKVHWVWVPFSQNRTLTLGSIYSLRLAATGGFDGKIWCAQRAEGVGPSPHLPYLGRLHGHSHREHECLGG